MYQSLQSFMEEYRLESASTQKLLDALTDASLKQEVAPGYRSLGQLAWHLVHNDEGMLLSMGLKFEAPAANSELPISASAIADAYRSVSTGLLHALESQWTDANLQEKNNMYGQIWPNGLTLNIYLKHEIHHRGQLTILMRQAGLQVPGVYGPSKEEWASMGVEAPV
ncbi:DinB family protein [Paenibacillus terrigena]|uniref:DinB family protein n=1 Tax=Paenibacillus terrigena TaxID=369333 RepID=UPI00037AE0A6|nr:DinB family protein [Paenibacillus terrigena]